jgi:hypothetical protein
MNKILVVLFLFGLSACGGKPAKEAPTSQNHNEPDISVSCDSPSKEQVKKFIKSLKAMSQKVTTSCDKKELAKITVASLLGASLDSHFGDNYTKNLDSNKLLELNAAVFDFRTCSVGTIDEEQITEILQSCKNKN